jgi:ribosomal protein L12E/L44/L45/RPP1/RPP2
MMEVIFYAILALHAARRPVNRDNIKAVLEKAGQPVDERALDALVAFIDSLTAGPAGEDKDTDPRIIRFLTAELAGQKIDTGRLENLLAEMTLAAAAVPAPGDHPEREDGRYIYGVIARDREIGLGPVGIEGRKVYTIPYRDLSAIVHDCPARPYQSTDRKVVEGWVRAHQGVLEIAREKFNTVVPVGFDTILRPADEGASPERVVTEWLAGDYGPIRAIIDKLEDKDEYGVRVCYDPAMLTKAILEGQEVTRLRQEVAAVPQGRAFLLRQKLEALIKAETSRLASEWFTDFYDRIKSHAADVVVARTSRLEDGRVVLMNLACLVDRHNVPDLGRVLEDIDNMDGFTVQFTGPWPAYNFAARPAVAAVGE